MALPYQAENPSVHRRNDDDLYQQVIACQPRFAAGAGRGVSLWEGVDKTWESSGAFAVFDCQTTVEHGGPCDANAVSPFWRPPHPSALSHAGIGNVIYRTFGAR